MSRVRARGGALERRAWAALAAARVSGWTRNDATLPGSPDVASRAARAAVFLNGCFWHGCARCYRAPRTNAAFWAAKVAGNRLRDRRVARRLRARGWRVVTVRECRFASGMRRAVRALEGTWT